MKLADALPAVKTGDVALFRGRSPFAWLVKLRTRSEYSHAGIFWRMKLNGSDRVVVIESLEPHGVRVFPLDRYVERGERIDWFALTDPAIDGERAAKFALQQWGAPYALRQLWWAFSRVAWVARLLFRRRPANVDPGRWFCSELVAAALLQAGYRPDPADGVDPDTTAPGAVARFTCLQRRGELKP